MFILFDGFRRERRCIAAYHLRGRDVDKEYADITELGAKAFEQRHGFLEKSHLQLLQEFIPETPVCLHRYTKKTMASK